MENVLGEVGGGFKVAMNILNNGRFGLGAGSGSMIKYLIGLTSEHALTRKQFGRTLSEFGLIKEKFAQMELDAYALESMVYMTTGMIDRGDKDCYVEAAICKVYGSEAGFRAANECIQVMGGLGFMADYPYERALRDARILSIFEGTNEILRMLIALSGVKGAGDRLKDLSKGLKNPLNIPSIALSEFKSRTATPDLSAIPSELSVARDLLASNTKLFGSAVESLLRTYGKDVVEQQLHLKRVADCVIDLYSMTAATSRATRSIAKKLPSAQHETRLANTICRQAGRRIKTNAAEIKLGKGHSEDKDIAAIADEVFQNKGYIPPHPVGSNSS